MRIYSLQIERLFGKLCVVVSVLGSAVKLHIFYGYYYCPYGEKKGVKIDPPVRLYVLRVCVCV